jgi:hypothetical protein
MRKLLCLLMLLLLAMPAQAARTLIVNANGYAFDAEGNLRRFATLFVGEDGRVLATLPRGQAEPKLVAGDFRLDARGRTLLPGLIDAHGHLMGLGFTLRQLDLAETVSLAGAQDAVRAHAAANPSAQWIVGGRWNQERWNLGRFPTAAELDAATGPKLAALERVDGHATWVNSAALKAAGITRATKDPPGGRIIRDAAGNPTGILVDSASDLVRKVVPPPSAGEREKALEAALQHMASVGLTGMHDMGTTPEDWALIRAFGDEGRLTARITAYAAGMEAMEAIAPLRPTPWLYGDRLRLQGIKLYADGALGSRGAWLKAPYADEPGTRGLMFLDDTKQKNLFSRANFLGYQVAVHAIGDAAVSQALDSFAEIRPTYGDRFRNRIEHAQVVAPADIPRMAELQLIASMQPTHAPSDRTMAEARLGPARLDGAYAWATLRKAAVRLALGSDFPVEPANPFYGIHAAVTRTDRQGNPPDGWRMADALTLEQALKGFTVDAAHAGRMENKVGTLIPGAHADFILLDRDPFQIAPAELWQVGVEESWLAGRRVWQKK